MRSPLADFGTGISAVVVGAGGGIGRALVAALAQDPAVGRVFAGSRQPPLGTGPRTGAAAASATSAAAAKASATAMPAVDRIRPFAIDVTDEASIGQAAAAIAAAGGSIDIVIVATGVLHDADGLEPEKRWEDLDADRLARAFAVNATGPALVARHFVPLLDRTGRSVFAVLSARVGSIADNRRGGWYAYRASKAALNMVIRTLAIELARRNPAAIAVALHPGTVDTGLSRPFRGGVPDSQIATPDAAANRLLRVVAGLDAADSGRLIAWNGETLPY